ncbi:MAG: hypothetical protein U0694_22155 [Anaerolineae bacterium]
MKWALHLPDDIAVYSSPDHSFDGGLTGLPGLERFVLPGPWFDSLGADGVAAQIARRIGIVQSESRLRAVFVAII